MRQFCAGAHCLPLGKRVYVMGILNVTPDSFSDGGDFFTPENALAHAAQMVAEGADILDVGGQSTRPGSVQITAEEEWARLAPVLSLLAKQFPATPISVDSFYPAVARRALLAGASVINDVTGFENPQLWELAAESDCGCIIMHPGDPSDLSGGGDILGALRAFTEVALARAIHYSVARERLCFDPGIGFGKTYEQNLQIIANADRLTRPECALMVAASRKRFIGVATARGKEAPEFRERLAGSLAAHSVAAFLGADFVRAHDVAEAVQAARVTEELRRWKLETA